MDGKRIVITGHTGFLGSALSQSLKAEGHTVIGVSRKPPRAGSSDLQWDPAAGRLDSAGLEGCDTVVHLAGESLAEGRWTAERKEAIRRSRVESTRLLAGTLARLASPPARLLSGSAVGFYGDRGDETLTEESPAGTGFLAEVSLEWEAATAPAEEAGISVAHLRTGIVLGPGGGVLEKMLPPFRAGLGAVFGSGKQWMSWIALADHVAAMRILLDHPEVRGPVNLVAPHPVTNREFTATLNRILGRPGFLPVPKFAVKLLFGEMGEATLLAGQRVLPRRLQEAGFTFRLPDLEPALREAVAP